MYEYLERNHSHVSHSLTKLSRCMGETEGTGSSCKCTRCEKLSSAISMINYLNFYFFLFRLVALVVSITWLIKLSRQFNCDNAEEQQTSVAATVSSSLTSHTSWSSVELHEKHLIALLKYIFGYVAKNSWSHFLFLFQSQGMETLEISILNFITQLPSHDTI